MRCPQCDNDIFDMGTDDNYNDLYRCTKCGCVFKYDIVIVKDGKEE